LEELINYGGDPMLDMDSGLFFHFGHHGDCMRFISISDTVTADCHDTGQNE